jgi:hypothetical protein
MKHFLQIGDIIVACAYFWLCLKMCLYVTSCFFVDLQLLHVAPAMETDEATSGGTKLITIYKLKQCLEQDTPQWSGDVDVGGRCSEYRCNWHYTLSSCDNVYFGTLLPIFRRKLLLPFSESTLKIEIVYSSERQETGEYFDSVMTSSFQILSSSSFATQYTI